MDEKLLSKRELCKKLNISETTIYRWIKEHDFPAHKIGFRWKFRASEVEKWSKWRLTGSVQEPVLRRLP